MSLSSTHTFRQLLESLQPYPQMQFLLFAQKWGELEEELLDFASKEDHTILLYGLGEIEKEYPIKNSKLRYRPYRIEQPRYNLQGRLYNHAFITASIPDNPEAFATKLYSGIANGGGVYLLSNPKETPLWQSIFENSNYVATSTIELSNTKQLLYARKMHGWGS